MTTLDMTQVSLAPISDTSSVLLLGQFAESVEVAAPATVRRYAGGRDRMVSSPGESTSVQMSCRFITRATYLSLLDLVGSAVLLRDQRGRVTAGVLGSVSATEWPVSDLLESITFSVGSISWSEIV